MPQAAIFDIDGTLLDSVDLHAIAWHDALVKFGHRVTFKEVRSQIGKGADQLIPVFLSETECMEHGEEMTEWRGQLFKSQYLPLVRPFSAVPELLGRVHKAGLKVAVASSATKSELDMYLDIACIRDLIDVATCAEDATQSKPAPDIFQAALEKLDIAGSEAVAIGDTPYDAEAAGKARIPALRVLCGGFNEAELRKSGCFAVYPGLPRCSRASTPPYSTPNKLCQFVDSEPELNSQAPTGVAEGCSVVSPDTAFLQLPGETSDGYEPSVS
jgi:HAD superfamily hydrolase (TIGR01549 family)